MTQKELLAEAVKTELDNIHSLNRLEALVEENRITDAAPKIPYAGSMIRYHSKLNAPKTITVVLEKETTDSVESYLFGEEALKVRKQHRHHPDHALHRTPPGRHHSSSSKNTTQIETNSVS